MNDTQEPSATDEQQDTGAPGPGPAPAGIDRQNLRNYERLHRSLTDRKVAGVAGGLGRHLNIDPTILRVLFVVLCFFGGAGFVAYGAAWLLVPEDGQEQGKLSMSPGTRNGLLIGVGVLSALLVLGDSWHGIGFPWPLLIVGVGVLLYLVFRDREVPTLDGPPPTGSTGYGYDPSYAPAPGAVPAGQDPAAYGAGAPPAPPWAPPQQQVPAYRPPRPKRGPKLFGITLALVALALGVLGLYDVSGGDVVDSAYPALALTVIGVMLVAGAFVGRAGGLIFLGLLAAFALAVTSILGTFRAMDLRDGQQVNAAPPTAAAVHSVYAIRSGKVSLDLSDVTDPQALAGRHIVVRGRAGELVVVLPRGIRSDVTAGIDGPGLIDLPDRSSGGLSSDLSGVYGAGVGTVTIDTHLSAGHIDVRTP